MAMAQQLLRLESAVKQLLAKEASSEDGLKELEQQFPKTSLAVLVSAVAVHLKSGWDGAGVRGRTGGRVGISEPFALCMYAGTRSSLSGCPGSWWGGPPLGCSTPRSR